MWREGEAEGRWAEGERGEVITFVDYGTHHNYQVRVGCSCGLLFSFNFLAHDATPTPEAFPPSS